MLQMQRHRHPPHREPQLPRAAAPSQLHPTAIWGVAFELQCSARGSSVSHGQHLASALEAVTMASVMSVLLARGASHRALPDGRCPQAVSAAYAGTSSSPIPPHHHLVAMAGARSTRPRRMSKRDEEARGRQMQSVHCRRSAYFGRKRAAFLPHGRHFPDVARIQHAKGSRGREAAKILILIGIVRIYLTADSSIFTWYLGEDR